MRRRYRFDDKSGKCVEVSADWGGSSCRSSQNVISDTMPLMRHPVTGKYYDSKSQFRRATREAGCYEVGNDQLSVKSSTDVTETPGLHADIKAAIDELS